MLLLVRIFYISYFRVHSLCMFWRVIYCFCLLMHIKVVFEGFLPCDIQRYIVWFRLKQWLMEGLSLACGPAAGRRKAGVHCKWVCDDSYQHPGELNWLNPCLYLHHCCSSHPPGTTHGCFLPFTWLHDELVTGKGELETTWKTSHGYMNMYFQTLQTCNLLLVHILTAWHV